MDDVEVIRDKLGVHAGLLADRNDAAQLGIGREGQGNDDFVDGVALQKGGEVADFADDPDAPVGSAGGGEIVHDAVDMVAPVRIPPAGVDEAVGNVREAHQNDMLLIEALLPHPGQDEANAEALHRQQCHIQKEEGQKHAGTEVPEIARFTSGEEHRGQDQQAHCIGLHDVAEFRPLRHRPLGLIQLEGPVQKEISRHHGCQCRKIDIRRQNAVVLRKGRDLNHEAPGQCIGKNQHHSIQQHMELVQLFLLIFNHIL